MKVITNEKTKKHITHYSFLSVAIIIIAALLSIAVVGITAHFMIHICSSTGEAFFLGAIFLFWVSIITSAVYMLYDYFQQKFMSHLVKYFEECLQEKVTKAYQEIEEGIKPDFIKE